MNGFLLQPLVYKDLPLLDPVRGESLTGTQNKQLLIRSVCVGGEMAPQAEAVYPSETQAVVPHLAPHNNHPINFLFTL